MRIVLDITLAPDGRPSGTARTTPHGDPVPFSGNLELLAQVQALAETHETSETGESAPTLAASAARTEESS